MSMSKWTVERRGMYDNQFEIRRDGEVFADLYLQGEGDRGAQATTIWDALNGSNVVALRNYND